MYLFPDGDRTVNWPVWLLKTLPVQVKHAEYTNLVRFASSLLLLVVGVVVIGGDAA